MWNLSCFHVETVLALVQDRCMVCARRTIGFEMILDAPDDAQVEAHFRLFGHRANLDAS